MDGKSRIGMRNWDFSGQSGNVDSVMKPVADVSISEGSVSEQHAAFLKLNPYHDRNSVLSEPHSSMSTMDFSWFPQRNFLSAAKSNLNSLPSTQVNLETDIPAPSDDVLPNGEFESGRTKVKKSSKKKASSVATKALRQKQPKKIPSVPTKKKESSVTTVQRQKQKIVDIIVHGRTLDLSSVPTPICSCTGVPRQCYRWGAGGWQSSCCTTTVSEYPLPFSGVRRGARLAGRKMSNGAYGKLLQRLASEGHDLSHAIDLKNYWAKHGTNKFITIR